MGRISVRREVLQGLVPCRSPERIPQHPPNEMNWQPIETAPKNCTDVLVLLNCAGVAVVHIAFWRSREEWELSGQYSGGWDSLEDWEGWWSYTENSVGQSKLDNLRFPTHWMPLPPLPTT